MAVLQRVLKRAVHVEHQCAAACRSCTLRLLTQMQEQGADAASITAALDVLRPYVQLQQEAELAVAVTRNLPHACQKGMLATSQAIFSPGIAFAFDGEKEHDGAASHTTLTLPGVSLLLLAAMRFPLRPWLEGLALSLRLKAQLAPSCQPHSRPLSSTTLLFSYASSSHSGASLHDTTGLGMGAAAGLNTHSLPAIMLHSLPSSSAMLLVFVRGNRQVGAAE